MNNPPTIIVTGSSGMVGTSIVSHFSQLGFRVRAFQRKFLKSHDPLISYHSFDLADVKDQGFQGAHYLVHCAYRPFISREERESGVNIDIEGTIRIISFCRAHGIKLIFLSTLSAHPDARSYYAKHKLIAEGLFDVSTDLILKLGIVLGRGGGLFGRILSSLGKYRIIPLIGGGRQVTQTIALDDLCRVLEAGIRQGTVGNFKIAHPARVTMKELYVGMADSIGARPFYISVSWEVAYRSSQILEWMGVSLPFTAENVLGLQDFRTFDTNSSLEVFGVTTQDYRATLATMKHE